MTPNVCVCILEKSYTDRKIYEHFHNHKILYMCIHKFQVIKQTIFPYYTRCITQKYQYQTIQYQPEGWNVMQFTKLLITKKKFNGKNYRECTNYMYIERKTAFYIPYFLICSYVIILKLYVLCTRPLYKWNIAVICCSVIQ